jgi:hypothetical protein
MKVLVFCSRKFSEMALFAFSVYMFSNTFDVWPLALYALIVTYAYSKPLNKNAERWWNVTFLFLGVPLIPFSIVFIVRFFSNIFTP